MLHQSELATRAYDWRNARPLPLGRSDQDLASAVEKPRIGREHGLGGNREALIARSFFSPFLYSCFASQAVNRWRRSSPLSLQNRKSVFRARASWSGAFARLGSTAGSTSAIASLLATP